MATVAAASEAARRVHTDTRLNASEGDGQGSRGSPNCDKMGSDIHVIRVCVSEPADQREAQFTRRSAFIDRLSCPYSGLLSPRLRSRRQWRHRNGKWSVIKKISNEGPRGDMTNDNRQLSISFVQGRGRFVWQNVGLGQDGPFRSAHVKVSEPIRIHNVNLRTAEEFQVDEAHSPISAGSCTSADPPQISPTKPPRLKSIVVRCINGPDHVEPLTSPCNGPPTSPCGSRDLDEERMFEDDPRLSESESEVDETPLATGDHLVPPLAVRVDEAPAVGSSGGDFIDLMQEIQELRDSPGCSKAEKMGMQLKEDKVTLDLRLLEAKHKCGGPSKRFPGLHGRTSGWGIRWFGGPSLGILSQCTHVMTGGEGTGYVSNPWRRCISGFGGQKSHSKFGPSHGF
ncbi:hypothetical protein QJS10_CPB20g00854 [Acorus calamus]|uniref:Uncharacterized protein n=1 Tax=Acorus calamus TaxID=4465 RepID=A0AAV9CDA8_ACOCL|nr:hypothetical protein QJS10_CPB20g00854 [Acorus calamus]